MKNMQKSTNFSENKKSGNVIMNIFKPALLLPLLALPLMGCGESEKRDDIVFLFTSDTHCAIDERVGFAHFAGYFDHMKETHDYAFALDAGDFAQGELCGTLSQGSYLIDLFNEVGYSAFTLGNHEFDFGMDALQSMVSHFNGDVLSCNLSYVGKGTNPLDEVMPYMILKAGETKIGVVGVTTPESLSSSNPIHFIEDGEYAYSFSADTAKQFYDCVQSSINSCKNDGADYVLVLSHLGQGEEFGDFSSDELAKNTTGVTAILDGHAHIRFDGMRRNKTGEEVLLAAPGHKLESFGKLTITKEGKANIQTLDNKDYTNKAVESKVKAIKADTEGLSKQKMASSDITLEYKGWMGNRLVRNRETQLGNMISDAFRAYGKTDIAFINGGSITDSLKKGDVTMGDLLSLFPYGNNFCAIKATGSRILDYLEHASRKVDSLSNFLMFALGESGGFCHPSGLKYTVDASIESPVKVDNYNRFIGIEGKRRIKDVMVLENNQYVPLQEDKTYTISGCDYLFLGGGDGANMFMDCEIISTQTEKDYMVIANYLNDLDGNLSTKYSSLEGRVTVK